MRVLVCWSGGKNSTRAVMEYHQRGYKVTAACYIPMFTKNIPLIDNQHYSFLMRCARWFRSIGIEVVFLKGISYYNWCSRVLSRGKNKGLQQGFPCFVRGKCGFARDGKIRVIDNYLKSHWSRYSYIDIGLCADEFDRKILSGKERSILRELGISDSECFYWCRDFQLLSPRYSVSGRDGCVLCPHAKKIERYKFFDSFPSAIPLVLDLQRISASRGFFPLRGKHWFIENDEFICGNGSQLSFLGDYVIY